MDTRTKEIVDGLSKTAQIKANTAITKLDEKGVLYFVAEGRRTLLTQCLYALQGRLDDIGQIELEMACASAGIRPPGKNKITWTLGSVHLDGDAIDIVPLVNGKPDWNNQSQDIINAFKDAGFIWGGDWDKYKDLPHFELR